MTSPFKPRPVVRAKTPNDRLNADGSEVIDRVPHEDLLMNPVIPTISEQIAEFTKRSVKRRESFYDALEDGDMGDWVDDDLSQPLSPYEVDALMERIDAKDGGPVRGVIKSPTQPPANPDPAPVG